MSGILGDAVPTSPRPGPSTTAVPGARGRDGNVYPNGNVFGVSLDELKDMPQELVTALREALESMERAMATGLPDEAAGPTLALDEVYRRIQAWRATGAIKAAFATPQAVPDGLAKRAGVTFEDA